MDTGHHLEYDGLRRAASVTASIAGATGTDIDEIAEETMARLLMQDGPVNNPKAWVRSTAARLAAQTSSRQRFSSDDVLEELNPTERSLVVSQRAGFTIRELAQRVGYSEDATRTLLTEANRKVRRSSRRLAGS